MENQEKAGETVVTETVCLYTTCIYIHPTLFGNVCGLGGEYDTPDIAFSIWDVVAVLIEAEFSMGTMVTRYTRP